MEENKIEEGNIIIGEFMGYKYYPDDTVNGFNGVLRHDDKLDLLANPNHEGQGHCSASWHTSWSDQIPVYSKLANKITSMLAEKLSKTKDKKLFEAILKNSRIKEMRADYENAIFNNSPISGFEIIIENLKWIKDYERT